MHAFNCALLITGALVVGAVADSARASCPGDLNGDGIVDAADIAAILANWGAPEGDLDGDGVVGGADIGLLLSGWGACAPPCEGYESMNYQGTLVGGAGSPFPPVLISGTVNVLPSSEPQGALIFVVDGTLVFFTLGQGTGTLSFDDGNVYLPSEGPVDLILIDGLPYLIEDVLQEFHDVMANPISPSQWSLASRAALLLSALVETQPYCCNLQASLEEATDLSFAYWAKIGAFSLGGAVVARAVDGCDDFDGCGPSGSTQIGKFAMPCQTTDDLCTKDQFAGPEATFDAVLGLWKGQ
jgi:hypothetical protein